MAETLSQLADDLQRHVRHTMTLKKEADQLAAMLGEGSNAAKH